MKNYNTKLKIKQNRHNKVVVKKFLPTKTRRKTRLKIMVILTNKTNLSVKIKTTNGFKFIKNLEICLQ